MSSSSKMLYVKMQVAMKDKTTRRQEMEKRFGEELKKIHDEYPDYVRSGLVEKQIWLRITCENQEAEKLHKKT